MANLAQLQRLQRSIAENNACAAWNHWHLTNEATEAREIDLCNVDLRGANLTNANLLLAYLAGARLSGAILRNADLRGTSLDNADLSKADLSYIQLNNADLKNANCRDADLTWASVSAADLSGANLQGAKLYRANLSKANLSYANLTDANLTAANLNGANLSQADLTNAHLVDATLVEVGMAGTQWPVVAPAVLARLQQEAMASTTPAARLRSLTWTWPGLLVQSLLASNPNLDCETLADLAGHHPLAFLQNPVVPLLFLEQPHWLGVVEASGFLIAVNDASLWSVLSPEQLALVNLIRRQVLDE